MVHHLFGARAFSIDPYQLGHDNREGLLSGAWWFYYKLGFRPYDPEVRRVLRGEFASPEQVQRLKQDHGVYMVNSSRINIAGITAGNVNYLAESIAAVL